MHVTKKEQKSKYAYKPHTNSNIVRVHVHVCTCTYMFIHQSSSRNPDPHNETQTHPSNVCMFVLGVWTLKPTSLDPATTSKRRYGFRDNTVCS